MPELRAIQERLGYLPDEDVKELAARLDVHLHELHEVISFFPHFRREMPPDVEVHVCRDMACHLGGQASCLSNLEGVAREFGGASRVKVDGTSCLGRCDGAPAVLIELHRKGKPDSVRVLTRPTCRDYVAQLRAIVAAHIDGRDVPLDPVDCSPRQWRIDPYQALVPSGAPGRTEADRADGPTGRQPYAAVASFAEGLKRADNAEARKAVGQGLIETLKTSDLRGMGGAGRPACTKWEEVRNERERADRDLCHLQRGRERAVDLQGSRDPAPCPSSRGRGNGAGRPLGGRVPGLRLRPA